MEPTPGWSSANGRTDVSAASAFGASELVDRLQIAERIARYGWCIDERRLEAMMANFTDDVIWDGSIMGTQSVGPVHGKVQVREFLANILVKQKSQRRHTFTNVVVDQFSESAATAHAYLILWSSENSRTHSVTTGPYRFTFRRVDQQWLIDEVYAGWDSPLDWSNDAH